MTFGTSIAERGKNRVIRTRPTSPDRALGRRVYKPVFAAALAALVASPPPAAPRPPAPKRRPKDRRIAGPPPPGRASRPEGRRIPAQCSSPRTDRQDGVHAKWESSFYSRATNKTTNGTTDYRSLPINSIHLRDGADARRPHRLSSSDGEREVALHVYKTQGETLGTATRTPHRVRERTRAGVTTGAQSPTPAAPTIPPPTRAADCCSATLDEHGAAARACSRGRTALGSVHDGSLVPGVSGRGGAPPTATAVEAPPLSPLRDEGARAACDRERPTRDRSRECSL